MLLRVEDLVKSFTLHLRDGVRIRVRGSVRVELRAGECVALAGPAMARGMPDADAREAARNLLRRLNIADRLHPLPAATFPGGEQQRGQPGARLHRRHPILLLDEPTALLDAANRLVVADMIRGAKARGHAILGIFRDEEVHAAVADRVVAVLPLQDAA